MLVAGVVRTGLTPGAKVAITSGASFVCLLVGWILSGGGGVGPEWFAVIPMIAKLGTLTFVLMSVGWCLLIFTYFYLVMDGLLLRGWALPIALVGRNALLLYLAYQLAHGWAETSAKLVLPSSPPWALTLQPLFISLIVLLVYWLLGFWLYRRRIFVKV
jgi:predicted acyltransferase